MVAEVAGRVERRATVALLNAEAHLQHQNEAEDDVELNERHLLSLLASAYASVSLCGRGLGGRGGEDRRERSRGAHAYALSHREAHKHNKIARMSRCARQARQLQQR